MTSAKIILDPESKIFSGSSRDVYRHPRDKTLLIKLMNTDRWDRKKKFLKKYLCHYYFTKTFVRETSEYIRLQFLEDGLQIDFLQTIIGFCHTNFGFGLVIKAELSESGEYAENLHQLIHTERINNEIIDHLKTFIEKILATPVIISDLNQKNIVYSYNRERQSYRFVLIDGIGDKTFIPVQKLFPYLRKYCKLKYLKEIQQLVERLECNELQDVLL